MTSKKHKGRSAPAVAAWNRKGGAHSGAKRPRGGDVFDAINEYGEEELEELARIWREGGTAEEAWEKAGKPAITSNVEDEEDE